MMIRHATVHLNGKTLHKAVHNVMGDGKGGLIGFIRLGYRCRNVVLRKHCRLWRLI